MTRKVKIGSVIIGGGEKIAVQSMSVFKPSDTENAVKEAVELKNAGCDILRFSVNDLKDAAAFKEIKERAGIPLVADIHFDYRLAIAAVEGGADKIRINPGNVGGENNVKEIARALIERNIPVRVGSNTGSIEKDFLDKYGKNEVSLGESALKNVRILEKAGVDNIVVSVKASFVPLAIKAYRYVAERCDYPLHIGVTEAGTEYSGIIKNATAMGALLSEGIGDTIRVSLSAPPVREVLAGRKILSALGLFSKEPELIACPTCGRCEWDCMGFAKKTEEYLSGVKKHVKVAVMGCAVNGPGEAKDADIGIAGGKDGCIIFVKGEPIKKVKKEDAEKEFFGEIERCIR